MRLLISLSDIANLQSGKAFPAKVQPFRNAYEYKPGENPNDLANELIEARKKRDEETLKPKSKKQKRKDKEYLNIGVKDDEIEEIETPESTSGMEFAHTDGQLAALEYQDNGIANQSIRARKKLEKKNSEKSKVVDTDEPDFK